jgi:hypothetical protein
MTKSEFLMTSYISPRVSVRVRVMVRVFKVRIRVMRFKLRLMKVRASTPSTEIEI